MVLGTKWRAGAAGLGILVSAMLMGGPTPVADAAGPTFDLTTVADKTYEFRVRGQRAAVYQSFAAFGSFHVDASGMIDSAKAWMSHDSPESGGNGIPLTIEANQFNRLT